MTTMLDLGLPATPGADGYLEAVRAELGGNQPDSCEQSAKACAWRWNPDNPYVNPEIWEGNGVQITWTPVSGWVLAGLRPDGSVTDRTRLELATWAEPDWAAWAVWDALTGHGCADDGPRRIWEGIPGLRTPTELLYIGGPFDGRTVTWQRTEPAAVSLTAGSYDGTWWPSGCYVLDHGDSANRSRFLWLGPAPLPVTGRPRTHVLAWFPGDLLGSPDVMNWQLFKDDAWAGGTNCMVLADELTRDCTPANLWTAVETEIGRPVLEFRAGSYTVAPVAPSGGPGEWHTCPMYDVVAGEPHGEDHS